MKFKACAIVMISLGEGEGGHLYAFGYFFDIFTINYDYLSFSGLPSPEPIITNV